MTAVGGRQFAAVGKPPTNHTTQQDNVYTLQGVNEPGLSQYTAQHTHKLTPTPTPNIHPVTHLVELSEVCPVHGLIPEHTVNAEVLGGPVEGREERVCDGREGQGVL